MPLELSSERAERLSRSGITRAKTPRANAARLAVSLSSDKPKYSGRAREQAPMPRQRHSRGKQDQLQDLRPCRSRFAASAKPAAASAAVAAAARWPKPGNALKGV